MVDSYTLEVGKEIYLLLQPTVDKPYRYVKGKIRRIRVKHTYDGRLDIIEVTKENKKTLQDSIKFIIDDVDNPKKYYLAQFNRIYPIENLDMLKKDIEIFTKLSKYKKKLEQDYYNYIEQNFKDWDCDFIPKF